MNRLFLAEVLPARFDVGHGMVYGPFHRSRECDIVVWDSANFPSLVPSFYFAESVRTVIEVKSRWSKREFEDVLAKASSVHDVIPSHMPNSVDQRLALLELSVASLRAGVTHRGMLLIPPMIGTAAIFLRGGVRSMSTVSIPKVMEPGAIDDEGPDLVLLLEAGVLVTKDREEGVLSCWAMGEDSLAGFTQGLLEMLAVRAPSTEGDFYFDHYLLGVTQELLWTHKFPLARLPYGRTRSGSRITGSSR